MDLKAFGATLLFARRGELRVPRRNERVATRCLRFETDLTGQWQGHDLGHDTGYIPHFGASSSLGSQIP